jgi:TetR/AcrR family transcriptional regulator, lmrAB and yxaGH operons repressor
MPRRSNARDQMIGTAVKLFRSKGYNGVGLTELLAVSQAPKGSFYHHFPDGKEELGEAAIDLSRRLTGALIEQAFARSISARDAVDHLAAALATLFEKSAFSAGCPIAAIAVDAMPQSARLTAAGQAALSDWAAIVVRHLARIGHSPDQAREFADRLAIALEGAWIVARVQQSAGPFALVASMTCDPASAGPQAPALTSCRDRDMA